MRPRLLHEWVLVAVLTCAIVAALLLTRASERLDNVLYDAAVGFAAPPPSDRIVLVVIDDASVARLGRWPWPRDIHERFLRRMAPAGGSAPAAAIAYDVLFTEAAAAGADDRLAAAMRRDANVVLPVLFEAPGSNGSAVDVLPPVPALSRNARALGHVALFPDGEGIVRSVPLSLDGGGRRWTHLMEMTYRIAQGHPSPAFVRLSARSGQRAIIPFRARSGDFRTVSFASVVAGEVPPDLFANRIVLVGASAAGLGDRFRIPSRNAGMISGVELQANVLNALLTDRLVSIPGLLVRLLAALVPLWALLLSFWWLRPDKIPLAFGAIAALVCLGPVLLLAHFAIWLAPTPALTGLLLAYPLWGWRRLHAIDRAMGEELDTFAAEDRAIALSAPLPGYVDRVGGQAARLRLAIADMRDMRRLVVDTIESVADPILVADIHGGTALTNAAARAVFGGDTADVPLVSLIERLAAEPPEAGDAPGDLRRHYGQVYALRQFPLRDHAGGLKGSIVHLVDVTTDRAARQVRQEALEFLSHDMRAPQSAIIALVERHRGAVLEPDLAERIDTHARRTLRLSDDFVHLARLAAAPFAPEDVDLADVMTTATDDLWPLASRRGVTIEVALAEETYFVRGERDTLSRLFANLLDNAVKFSPNGGRVRCSVEASAGGMIRCMVEDEGPGIPEARRADLFARFGYKARAAGPSVSSGLGLAYVAAAVKRHEGRITCEPRAPHGTCFAVYFAASA